METIKQMLERKIEQAKIDLRNSRAQRELDIAKADQRIAVCSEKLDAYENLLDLDWKLLAKNTLEAE